MAASKRSASSAFRDAVDEDAHSMQLGENGMPEYTNLGVGSKVLAISQMVRGGDPSSLVEEILANDASVQDIVDLIVLTFVTRNTRGGKGEKDLSYKIFLRVWNKFPNTAKALLSLFPHYGYYKDMLRLMDLAKEDASVKGLDNAALELMSVQLKKDLASLTEYNYTEFAMDNHDSSEKRRLPKISLLAKWLPREGSHFDKKLSFVDRFAAVIWPSISGTDTSADSWESSSKSKYRKIVSELTFYLELPEVLLSAQREDEINFGKVASKATLLLTKTFLNEDKNGAKRSNDPKRVRMAEIFIDHMLSKGLKGSQLMPHEIVRKIMYNSNITRTEELVLDAQWKDLWKNVVAEVKAKAQADGVDFDPTRMVPLSDVSSSMNGVPMEVSSALGIGISEITHEAFQNMVITFQTAPQWHQLVPTDSIMKKVRSLASAPWGGSTNFLGAFELILDVCKKHRLSRDDMPSLIVFSDMQFNQAEYGYSYSYNQRSGEMKAVLDEIKAKVADVAASCGWSDAEPTPIVFWNLRNTDSHPVNKSAEGAVLLSGFSPSLLKLVMNGEALREEEVEVVQRDGTVKTEKIRVSPEQVLRKMLEDSMYDPVRAILSSSTKGALLEFGTLEKELGEAANDKVDEDESDFLIVE